MSSEYIYRLHLAMEGFGGITTGVNYSNTTIATTSNEEKSIGDESNNIRKVKIISMLSPKKYSKYLIKKYNRTSVVRNNNHNNRNNLFFNDLFFSHSPLEPFG